MAIQADVDKKQESTLHTYPIRYTETYSKVYMVRGKNYEDAKAILMSDIQEGREDGPEECVDSEWEFAGWSPFQ